MTDTPTIYKGTIKGFRGSWLSGLATLLIEDQNGTIHNIPCDNAPTVRALESCFGNTISDAHTVNPQGGFIDQEIYYSMDELGIVFAGFTPVSEASEELISLYENQKED